MNSCDLSLVSEKIDGLDYDDAVLCAGLNNMLCVIPYADGQIYMVRGRGIELIDQLFDRLGLKYRRIGIPELFENSALDPGRVLVILPYIEFDRIGSLKEKVVQFFTNYSTYAVVRVTGEKAVLRSDHTIEEVEKPIDRSSLEKLARIRTKPIGVSVRILYLEEERVRPDQIRSCILDGIERMLRPDQCEDDEGAWYKGGNFYGRVADVLKSGWNTGFNRVMKYAFLQSIQTGSSFFYRREYYEALEHKYLVSDPELKTAGNLWRKLSRELKCSVTENRQIENSRIDRLLEDIRDQEETFFKKMRKEF